MTADTAVTFSENYGIRNRCWNNDAMYLSPTQSESVKTSTDDGYNWSWQIKKTVSEGKRPK